MTSVTSLLPRTFKEVLLNTHREEEKCKGSRGSGDHRLKFSVKFMTFPFGVSFVSSCSPLPVLNGGKKKLQINYSVAQR